MGETYRKDWACDIWEVWVEWERLDSPLGLHWQLEEPAHLLLELAHQTCVDAMLDDLEEAPVGACGSGRVTVGDDDWADSTGRCLV